MVRSLLISTVAALLLPIAAAGADCIILLHGLSRTANSMKKLESGLLDAGYVVVNVDYPSRHHSIDELAPMAVQEGIDGCADTERVHFVTHSLGGILVRLYLESNAVDRLGRVVMLAPPNHGSQIVDSLSVIPGYSLINGPAGSQLGTGDDDIPAQLQPVYYDVGVIAGTHSVYPVLSQLLPNPDDGIVSVESTKFDGMKDFLLVYRTHTYIMNSPEVLEQSISFLETGRFIHADP
jgi:triacylglycerol lipase